MAPLSESLIFPDPRSLLSPSHPIITFSSSTQHQQSQTLSSNLMAQTPPATRTHLRTLYRALLRELPAQPHPSSPSTPLQQRLRASFRNPSPTHQPRPDHLCTTAKAPAPSSSFSSSHTPLEPRVRQRQLQEAEQFIHYIRAQRMYTTLLERYNPGMGADEGEGERVRLTARRVGMEMPREWYEKKGGDGR